jgi:hypothetical protein
MTLEPTWVSHLDHNWVTLKRHQVGSLCLVSHLPDEDRDGWLHAQFCDAGGRGQSWQWPPQVAPGLLALVRVTITRDENDKPYLVPVWLCARPFSAVFVVTGWGEGGLSVRHAKFKRRHWWSRPAIRLGNLDT